MHEESVYRSLGYNPEKCYSFGMSAIERGDVLWIVAEQSGELIGMLGATVQEMYFADGLVANDNIVYVTPEHRGGPAFKKLVSFYVDWSMIRGAEEIFMSVSNGVVGTSTLFKRLGFKMMGGIFRLEI